MDSPQYTYDEMLAWPLDDYERGFCDGIDLYAWWKDGVCYVGTTGTTRRDAVAGFLASRGYQTIKPKVEHGVEAV